MPMNKKEREARDARRAIGAELLGAVRSVKAGKVGAVNMVPVSVALEVRQRLGMPQVQCVGTLVVSGRTSQD